MFWTSYPNLFQGGQARNTRKSKGYQKSISTKNIPENKAYLTKHSRCAMSWQGDALTILLAWGTFILDKTYFSSKDFNNCYEFLPDLFQRIKTDIVCTS